MDKKVEIFSTPSCHFCHMAKDFFKEEGVEYTDHNVAEDKAKREEMVELTQQLGVPVIKIGDEFTIGFNEEEIKNLLNK